MDEVKLLPCPFCGGEASLCDPHAAFSHLAAVFCDDCEIRGQLSVDAQMAIEFWNTRPTLVTDELVERVKSAIWNTSQDHIVGVQGTYPLKMRMSADEARRAAENALAAMPAIPPQSLGDHALPPSGLSRDASQAKPAAAIARGETK